MEASGFWIGKAERQDADWGIENLNSDAG